jgi:ABC-type multidrug transport system ATPase subunit
MALLELERVTMSYGRPPGERVALREVSLELEAGELVAVWGRRRSGRSTLLRVAAGVEIPDHGTVRFAGRDLAARGAEAHQAAIGYCHTSRRPAEGELVLDQLVVDQLTRGSRREEAHARSRAALGRAGAGGCAERRPAELDCAEAVRVAIARALTRDPKLIVIDEPLLGVDLLERDGILRLLRSLADEGIAILTSTGETTGLSGADRALALDDGELCSPPPPALAPVVPLRRPA